MTGSSMLSPKMSGLQVHAADGLRVARRATNAPGAHWFAAAWHVHNARQSLPFCCPCGAWVMGDPRRCGHTDSQPEAEDSFSFPSERGDSLLHAQYPSRHEMRLQCLTNQKWALGLSHEATVSSAFPFLAQLFGPFPETVWRLSACPRAAPSPST